MELGTCYESSQEGFRKCQERAYMNPIRYSYTLSGDTIFSYLMVTYFHEKRKYSSTGYRRFSSTFTFGVPHWPQVCILIVSNHPCQCHSQSVPTREVCCMPRGLMCAMKLGTLFFYICYTLSLRLTCRVSEHTQTGICKLLSVMCVTARLQPNLHTI